MCHDSRTLAYFMAGLPVFFLKVGRSLALTGPGLIITAYCMIIWFINYHGHQHRRIYFVGFRFWLKRNVNLSVTNRSKLIAWLKSSDDAKVIENQKQEFIENISVIPYIFFNDLNRTLFTVLKNMYCVRFKSKSDCEK